ncbi:MAG: hypothetical protein AAF703_14935 [Cyanobacteria bacterium P01_D01_bin.105]
MQNRDFEGPSLLWAVASIAGGIATAIALIWILENSRKRFPKATHFLPAITASSPAA